MMKYLKVIFIFVFIMFFMASVFAVEFVKPDTANKRLLELLPNHSYKLSFLDTYKNQKIISPTIITDLNYNLVKEGPYYFLNVSTNTKGLYNLAVSYKDDENNLINDVREINVGYDKISFYVMLMYNNDFATKNPFIILVKNDSDSDLNVRIYSNLPDESFKPFYAFVKAHSVLKTNVFFKPFDKGQKTLKFYADFGNGFKKEISTNKVFIHYGLRALLKDNLNTFYIINPLTELFASIRTLFGFL